MMRTYVACLAAVVSYHLFERRGEAWGWLGVIVTLVLLAACQLIGGAVLRAWRASMAHGAPR